ncbi:MAG: sigma-70 family RNA polymerase sigma factor [Chloroflexi bacterium]|nr:sigma-70 family RNA polymerase sigma factor [Chloroflexota bacterium]
MRLPGQPGSKNEQATPGLAQTFTQLYEQYLPKVYRFISYRVADIHMAEDLTSLVFEKALTGFTSYNPNKAAFSTWIFSIARNTVIDHFRTSRKDRTLQLDDMPWVPDGKASPEDEAIRAEESRRLAFCMSTLGNNEQEIISYKFGGEMNNRQISAMLGLSESNVGTIIYRAVRKLADCVRGQNGR